MTDKKTPYFFALLPILVLIALLAYNVFLYGDNSLGGANQLALLFAAATASIVGIKFGAQWKTILDGMSKSISSTTPSLIILLLIGALAGTWLLSGIVPAMIYYGLQILNPTIFLFATAIITAIVSLATGSSWSTIATIGIALLGIGQALGFPTGLIGGAIISGAYFGDKMSPLSDTTNLAPAMAGTDLFTHIKYMMYTTIPSFAITLIIFLIIGFTYTTSGTQDISELLTAISNSFNVSGWLFLVPVLIIALIIKKIPAIPALLAGTLLGGIFAIIFQPEVVMSITNAQSLNLSSAYMAVINAMGGDISITTENEMINKLLSTSGMAGMLNTIWLIICAMIFGGAMEATGLLKRVAEPIIEYADSTGSLIATTAGTCIFFNITASDQYLSIVVPGRMFTDTYKEKGLAPENLSRTLEDSGTVTSVLIPWNTCGATQSAVLGVATFTYLPFCFFNLISPLMTIAYGYLGIKIKKLENK
ncbi:MAG: Na+/H+ antiporter NhaC [Flavobacteriales bacterium]|nr:Na+/H+ antiporter NhaC [Flavobacteriales bacterium]